MKAAHIFIVILLLINPAKSWSQIIYEHKFNTVSTSYPYTAAPDIIDGALANNIWTNTRGAWTFYDGVDYKALATTSASAQTLTINLALNISPGSSARVTGFSFYQRSSNTGYSQWTMLVNGITVGTGNIYVDVSGGSHPVQPTGLISVSNPVNNISGTLNVSIVLSGGAHGSNGTFRFDDFTLYGTTYATSLLSYTPGIPINYIRVHAYKNPITNPASLPNVGYIDEDYRTVYKDGLGRSIQGVKRNVPGALNNDLVQSFSYDQYGRQTQQQLPFTRLQNASSTNDGRFDLYSGSDNSNYYINNYAAEAQADFGRIIDNNDLDRSVTTMHAGNSFEGANVGVNTHTTLNDQADDVRQWTFTNVTTMPSTTVAWGDNTLTVTETIKEDGSKSRKYTDNEGKTVLSKIQANSTAALGNQNWLCTYMVYDDYGRLRFVLPPKLIDKMVQQGSWTTSQADYDALAYSYDYDERGRVIMKKLPGKASINIVYDQNDRPVLVQDGNLSAANQWLFTKYDGLGRAIITGKYLNSAGQNRQAIADQINGTTTIPFMSFLNTTINANTYTTTSTIQDAEIYTLQYFDGYSNTPAATYDNTSVQSLPSPTGAVAEIKSTETMGMLTGMQVRVMNGNTATNTWTNGVNFYNTNGQVIQSQHLNFKGGKDITSLHYNFSGNVVSSKNTFSNLTVTDPMKVPSISFSKVFSYDGMDRPIGVYQNINNNEPFYRMLNHVAYDDFSRLLKKQIGQVETQDITYRIWGALESINKNFCQTGLGSNYFGEMLYYDQADFPANLTGTPAGMRWRLKGSPAIERSYGYTYDRAGRLTSADYTQWDALLSPVTPSWSNTQEDYTATNMSYDANGNLQTMKQYGTKTGYSAPFLMDDLNYVYNNAGTSNQLQSVTDNVPTDYGLGEFKDLGGITPNDYGSYDDNGNATQDLNKNITSIQYNYLNKPYQISFTNSRTITFAYDATGTLLTKRIIEPTLPDKVKDYLGGLEYDDNALTLIENEEGRTRPVVITSTSTQPYLVFENDYLIKDHQGNVRSVATEAPDANWWNMSAAADPRNLTWGSVAYNPVYTAQNAATLATGVRTYLLTNELSMAATEEKLFSNVPNTREPNGGSDPANQEETQLDGTTNTIGPSIALRVMAGDDITLSVASMYEDAIVSGNGLPDQAGPIVSDLLMVLSGTGVYNGLTDGSATLQQTFNNQFTNNVVGEWPAISGNTDLTKPHAFLNYIYLDDNMQVIPGSSGQVQTTIPGSWQTLSVPEFQVAKNGYLFVYLSNESQGIVHFDNLQIIYNKGPLQSENHYYPYGLTINMPGALPPVANNTLFCSGELNHNEFSDNTGLDWYDFDARQYDPQIGMWHSADPLTEAAANWSPYRYGFDNPVAYSDRNGMEEGDDIDGQDVTGQGGSRSRGGNGWLGRLLGNIGNAINDALGSSRDGSNDTPTDEDFRNDDIDALIDRIKMAIDLQQMVKDAKVPDLSFVSERKDDRRSSQNDNHQQKVQSGKYIFNLAYVHYMQGTGTPITIDASTLNFSGVSQKNISTTQNADGSYLLDLYKGDPDNQAALALGKINVTPVGNNQYTINDDVYDFNIEWQNGFSKRNIATFGAGILERPTLFSIFTAQKFTFHFVNTVTINP